MPSTTDRLLSTAAVRRATVVRTAVRAFADRGFYGTSTAEVAELAAISQAYVYRLFPDKRALFAAVVEHTFQRVSAAFERGAADAAAATPEAVLDAMGDAYARLIADRDLLLVQLHAQAAAASDPQIRAVVRAGYAVLVDQVRRASLADENVIQRFFATGLLCHVVTALSVEEVRAPWADILMGDLRHYTPTNDGGS